ncbi:hypothetical protein [Sphingomonas sp. GM_Shp_1]|uniref:HTH domain-containing protein n=1 Tax=Sphingomonas sp. GM_Shp_1 TaxID=2937381 RepID=UPI00226B6388|nr:hypothetical protein [Sphingomonas sp. GM_Shp_1]
MASSITAIGLKVAAPAVLAGYRAFQYELARRSDDRQSVDLAGLDDVLDEALAVLAGSALTLWGTVQVAAKGLVARPALFQHSVPRAWIATEEAQTALKMAASAALRGDDDAPHAERAFKQYMLFARDDPAAPEVGAVYGESLDFLLLSLRRAFTPGDRAILQAVHGLGAKLEAWPENTVLIDAHIHERVGRLRAQRFFRSANSSADAATLIAELLEGPLRGGSVDRRAFALAWCARVLSFAEPGLAQVAIEKVIALGRSELLEARIAQAFVAAATDFEAGLRLLDVDESGTAATAVFQILRRGLGTQAALVRAQEAGIDMSHLDSDGRYSLITALMETGQWERALEATRALQIDDFEATPALLWITGTLLVAVQLPSDLKSLVLQDIPQYPRALPLRDDEASREQRQLAGTFMERAAAACVDLGLSREAQAATRYSLWLRLRDPRTAPAALKDLKRRIDIPGSELVYLPLALPFDVGVDRRKAEELITRRIARGLGDATDVATATLALLLDHARHNPKEALAFLDRNRLFISDFLDPLSLTNLEVSILISAGRHGDATALLEAASATLPAEMHAVLQSALDQSDFEPSLEVLEQLYAAEPKTALLDQLVRRFRGHDYDPRFLVYARQLLTELPTQDSALACLAFLGDHNRDAEAAGLIELLGKLVDESPLLAIQAGWVYFRLGNLQRAEVMLASVGDGAVEEAARSLRFHLLVSGGNWEAIDAFLEEQWQARATRSPQELAKSAMLAAQIRAKRVVDLVREAVARAPDDAQVLVAAYSAATTAGLEEAIPEASHWLMHAAELSGEGGPIEKRSISELLDSRPDWEARVDEANRGWAEAQLPLVGVAMMLTRPWLELQLSPMIHNAEGADHRRQAVPLFSGRVRIDDTERFTGGRVALDRHAIVTLAATGVLSSVVAALDDILVPHDLFSDLFEQRQRVAFHQPSKVAFAHRLLELLARGRVKAFEASVLADVGLVSQIGQSLAALLCEAAAQEGGQHLLVHPFPITRVGSLLSEPVDLTRYASHIVSCSAVLAALDSAGRLSQAERKRAADYFALHDASWPDEPAITQGATLYLSDLSVDYFRYTGLIDKIAFAGFTVVVARTEINEAEALREMEGQSRALEEVIDEVRRVLVPGFAAGRIRLDAAPVAGEGVSTFPAIVTSLAAGSEILVSDDRVINRHTNFELPTGRIRILTSLDLLDLLARSERLDGQAVSEARSRLRRGGVTFIGTSAAELIALVAEASAQGFRETGELRAIRENIRIAQKRGWFDAQVDIGWLTMMQGAFADAIGAQWSEGIEDETARAASRWLLSCYRSQDWAQSEMGAPLEGLAVNGMMLDLVKLASLYGRIEVGARERYAAWFREEAFDPILISEPRLDEPFKQTLRHMLVSIADEARAETPQVDFRQALALALRTLPDFLQLHIADDDTFRVQAGQTIEATVEIGEAQFLRSVFYKAAGAVYAKPDKKREIRDQEGRRWTLGTDGVRGGWSLLLVRGGHRYRTRGIIGLHPDADVRVTMLDAALADFGHTPSALALWRERLEHTRLDVQALDALDRDVRALPGAVEGSIRESLAANEASIALLVPPTRAYWEALVGAGEASHLDDYLANVGPRQIARIRADAIDADKMLLLLAAHSAVLGDGRFGTRTLQEWCALGEWASSAGDPLAKVGFIELALPHASDDEALETLIIALVDEIEAIDADDETSSLHLLSSLAMFVDGELSRLGLLAAWPPFRRRHASLAQAALISRVVDGEVDTAHFARFCTRERGWRYFAQNLVDMQREPYWRPDLIATSQLRHEMIGRIVNAAGGVGEVLSERLRRRLLADHESLRARMTFPQIFWPGPLEGGNRLPALPDDLCNQLDQALAQETPTLEMLTLLVNAAAMFTIPADLAERASARICSAGFSLLALIPAETLYGHLTGLALVAASHRLEALADAVRLLARLHRHQVAWPVAEEVQLALYAAASRTDTSEWRAYLGHWLAEVSASSDDSAFAEQLLDWIEALNEIDPVLRTRTASTVAAIRLLLDR